MERECTTMTDMLDEANAELNSESPTVGAILSAIREISPDWTADLQNYVTGTAINLIEGKEVISPSCPDHSNKTALGR
jgi:hypothetical protein